MSRAYYNEIDDYAAQWLRNLISEGLIAPGDVDERSIVDVRPGDLDGYQQCHFFAGIGGWSYALRLAGWPDDRPVWTGSCPCQPLSVAGQRKGHTDQRHLWPAFYSLIAERAPSTVFGEQVASKDGREWLAGVRLDLEAMGYACGGADLCAAGVGAPHPRQRLYWVADTGCSERPPLAEGRHVFDGPDRGWEKTASRHPMGGENAAPRLANASLSGEDGWPSSGKQSICDGVHRAVEGMVDTDGYGERRRPHEEGGAPGEGEGEMGQQDRKRIRVFPVRASTKSAGLGNAAGAGLQGEWGEYRPSGARHSGLVGLAMQVGVPEWNGPTIAVQCSDGPRRVSAQSDSFPLAHGVSGRMGRLRAFGNAIVPQVAAAFIQSYLEAIALQSSEAT